MKSNHGLPDILGHISGRFTGYTGMYIYPLSRPYTPAPNAVQVQPLVALKCDVHKGSCMPESCSCQSLGTCLASGRGADRKSGLQQQI